MIAFIYADLLAFPLLLIYRKYYGTKMALYLAAVMFVSVVLTGIIVDRLFDAVGLIPTTRASVACVMAGGFGWNLTTALNIFALIAGGWMFWAGRTRRMNSMK